MALGLDVEEYFKKDKFMRMFIVGGFICDNAVSSMRQFDLMKDRENKK